MAAALGMLLSPNPVHSALYLILNFACLAVLYLVLQAPVIAALQVIVYAGAIMVLFLFVVMLLGGERAESGRDELRWQKPLGILAGLVLVLEMVYLLGRGAAPAPPPPTVELASPHLLGRVLFRDYLLPFEVTSLLLLVAMIGAVVLGRAGQEAPRVVAEESLRQPDGREAVEEPAAAGREG